MISPYNNKPVEFWKDITEKLIEKHPININELKNVILKSWNDIISMKIGNFKIGIDIYLSPQILGNLLHELIALYFENNSNGLWFKGKKKFEKDLVYKNNDLFSIEIKTSSSQNDIFGNASYGKEDSSDNSTKSKSGYYLAINFDKFEENNPNFKPCIRLIRFGWLDHTDWHSQQKPSGQQSRISREVRDNKLKIIYKNTAINENYEDNNLDNNFLEYFF